MATPLSVRGALGWSFAERYANLLVNLASAMLLARWLTPAQVGVFSVCASFTTVAGILRDFGVSEYLIQEKDLDHDKMRAAFAVALGIAWSIGAMIFLARHSVAGFYGEPGVASVLAVLSLNFLLLPLASPAFAIMNRELAFRKIFLLQIVSNGVQASVALTLAYRGHGYMSLAWGPVAGIAAQVVLTTLLRPRDSLLMPGLKSVRGVLHYGGMFVMSRVIETFTRNAHEFIIAKQSGFAAVGIFSRAFGLIELFNSNVTSAVMRVASPAFATNHRAGIELKSSFARGTAVFTSVAFPFCAFIALMAGDIIRVLFGPQWDAAAPLARILAIALIPFYLIALAPQLMAATGQVRRRLQVSFWFSPVHLAGVVVASFISLEAVAMVWGVSNSVMLLMYMSHLKTVLKATARELFLPSLASVVVAVASLATQLLALALCRELAWPALARLVVVTAAGALGWLAAVRTCRHPVYDELMRLARHRRALPA